VWSPDGSRVAFRSVHGGRSFVHLKAADGSSGEEPLDQAAPVLSAGPYDCLCHKTAPFYRDVLGLPMNGDPLNQKPQKLDADMSRFTGTEGMSFRAAMFRIPNDAGFGLELTEFTGAARTTCGPRCRTSAR
jgi:hypothetical protein